ncbi:MAG: TonB-dependent receptor [Brumimicrobium sp.]
MRHLLFLLAFFTINSYSFSQNGFISGVIKDSENKPLTYVKVTLEDENKGAYSDEKGEYFLGDLNAKAYTLIVNSLDYGKMKRKVTLEKGDTLEINFVFNNLITDFDEVVISGTMKEVRRSNSPVPIEVYTDKFFKANPTPTIFESLQNVNGVRPQINCSVCNTGDIHINGLEGPYTMILIDGMPIVSGLSTVYGLNGIPQALIERVEIVKGPASTLYGSEAVGGVINVITKSPSNTPKLTADIFGTSWGEINTDIGYKFNINDRVSSILGVNYYNYSNPIDNNDDGFTDMTLQDRVSIFNKWTMQRKDNRIFSVAGRYVYEDRWGGEMDWTKEHRGGDEIYGESIYTNRSEIFGTYQLPMKEKVLFMFSANSHEQNSVYGEDVYIGDQKVGFGQFTWDKKVGNRHDFLLGTSIRYTYYDDNTTATESSVDSVVSNNPSKVILPGVFLQDEIKISEQHRLLLGLRYDYNSVHGDIFTPRINYKWASKNKKNIVRLSGGRGYRVANIFTEDHAALTGSRELVLEEKLAPETSWNGNLNIIKKIITNNQLFVTFDGTVFYTYFENKIIPDYETDPNKIIYKNIDGYAESKGVSLNIDIRYKNFSARLGGTVMDVSRIENGNRIRQEFQEEYTAVWNIGYTFSRIGMMVEYTGNLYGPMKLPLLSDTDPRQEYSNPWSIQNIQVRKSFKNGIEIYGGVKNLLNWTPNKGNPFIIARADDPFDENVIFDSEGQAVPTAENPYGLTFDPAYIYGPNQGTRAFIGVRYAIK